MITIKKSLLPFHFFAQIIFQKRNKCGICLKIDSRVFIVKRKNRSIRDLRRNGLAVIISQERFAEGLRKFLLFFFGFRCLLHGNQCGECEIANRLRARADTLRDHKIILLHRIDISRQMIAVKDLKAQNGDQKRYQLIKKSVLYVQQRSPDEPYARDRQNHGSNPLALFILGRNVFHKNSPF